MEGYAKLGPLEQRMKITTMDGREAVTVTTPSMWALADEFADELRRSGRHTEAWVMRKFGMAIQLQAARAECLFPDGPITNGTIAEFINSCTVENLPDEDAPGESAENPTQAVQDGNREAE